MAHDPFMVKQHPHPPPASTMAERIRRSVFLAPANPRSEADRSRFLRRNLLLHFRPPTVEEKTLKFTLTWGLGGMAVTLVMLQMVTGMLLKFIYVPTPVDAYTSVQAIVYQVPFGRLIRNIHHWCANLLVIILMLHMLRVFFTGAFHAPRQFNWIIGLGLFTLILTANLSGYLLPYDQLAYWAVTVLTSMTGYIPGIGGWLQQVMGNGTELGSQTLPLFFSMHTAVIPVLLVGLMGFHFWRIRKAGGLVMPRDLDASMDASPSRIAAIPHLLVRELAMALILTAVVMVVSVLFDASLSAPANPGLSPNPVRAPWYFAGLQELLLHFHPTVAVSVFPLFAGLFLMSIPYLAYPNSTEGIWFASSRGKKISVFSAIAMLIVTPILIVVDTQIAKTAPWAAQMNPLVRDGIIPLLLLSVLVTVYVVTMRKKVSATLNEIIQSLFVLMITALVVLTVVGVFFRGPFMKLVWLL